MQIFDVRKSEARPVALSLLLSFFVGLPRVFTFAAANDLFVSTHGASKLPWAYSAGAFVLAALGLAYVQASRRVTPRRLGIGVFVLLAVANVGAYLALKRYGPGAVSYALIVGVEAEVTLTSITFWNTAYRLFSIQQARRLFGLISAGEVIPSIAGGLALPWIVGAVGVPDLLLISIGGHAAAAIAFFFVETRVAIDVTEPPPAPRLHGEAQKTQSRYLRWIGVIVGLNVFVYYAVDNAFFHATENASLATGALAAFLGKFFVALGVASLLFKVFLSGRWRAWLGLRAVLSSAPATLAVLAGIVVLVHGPLGTPTGALLSVMMLKLWERLSIEAIHVPAYNALLLPLPPGVRSAAQGTLEGVVAHGATLFGGGVLLALNLQFGFGVEGLTIVALIALVLWGAAAFRVADIYRDVLRTALVERRLDTGGLKVADGTTLKLVEEGLSSPEPSRVLWSIHLLRELRHPRIDALAGDLLDHPDAAVVEAAARLLEKEGSVAAAPAISKRLERSDDPPKVRARLLRALSATDAQGSGAVLKDHLGDPSPVVAAAAIVGLFQLGGKEGAHAASPRLVVMARSSDASARRVAARAIGSIRSPAQARLLIRLLRDRDISVQRAATRAAGKIDEPSLWPFVVDGLGQRRLRADATEALVRAGPGALDAVLTEYERPDQYWRLRHRLLHILARIGGPRAYRALHDACEGSDVNLRHTALIALERAAPKLGKDLVGLVDVELGILRTLLRARAAAAPWVHGARLVEAIDRDAGKSLDRLLVVLSLRFGGSGLREAREFATSPSEDDRSIASELLEQGLPTHLADQTLPVIRELAATQFELPSHREAEPSEALRAALTILAPEARDWGMRWLATCALDAATRAGVTLETRDLGASATMVERVDLLLGTDLFKGLSGEQLSDLAVRATERTFEPHAVIIEAGQTLDRLYILREGMVGHATAQQRPGLMTAGYSTESLALLRAAPSTATLTAESEVRMLEVRAEHLQDLLDDDLEAAWGIAEAVCDRMRRTLTSSATRPAAHQVRRPEAPLATSEERSYYDVLQRLLSLRSTPALSAVDERVLLAIAEAAEEATFAQGQTIVDEGDLGTTMFILVEGAVRVHTADQVLAEFEAPNLFGELSAIAPAPRSASITASRPSRALRLSRSVLFRLAVAEPDVLRLMIDLILDRMGFGGTGPNSGPVARPSFVTDDMTL